MKNTKGNMSLEVYSIHHGIVGEDKEELFSSVYHYDDAEEKVREIIKSKDSIHTWKREGDIWTNGVYEYEIKPVLVEKTAQEEFERNLNMIKEGMRLEVCSIYHGSVYEGGGIIPPLFYYYKDAHKKVMKLVEEDQKHDDELYGDKKLTSLPYKWKREGDTWTNGLYEYRIDRIGVE